MVEELRKIPDLSSDLVLDEKGDLEEVVVNYSIYDDLEKEAKIKALIERNKNTKKNRQLRKKYARWVYRYLVVYSVFVASALIANGFNILGFHLADSVMEILVGSTAVSAIGLVYAVTNGLFKNLDQ